MAIELVQTAVGSVNGTSLQATFSAATKKGNAVLVFITAAGGAVSAVADGTNTYSSADANYVFNTPATVSTYYSANIVGGAAYTVTATIASGFGEMIIREYSGLSTAPLDQVAHATGSSAAPNSGASALTTSEYQLVVGVAGFTVTDANSVGAGYINYTSQRTASAIHAEDKLVGSSGAQTALFGTSSIFAWGCQVITFKAASGPSFKAKSLRPAVFAPGLAR